VADNGTDASVRASVISGGSELTGTDACRAVSTVCCNTAGLTDAVADELAAGAAELRELLELQPATAINPASAEQTIAVRRVRCLRGLTELMSVDI
jgi:hypothetical protein